MIENIGNAKKSWQSGTGKNRVNMSRSTASFRPPASKVCNACRQEKPMKDFNRNNDAPDGRHNKCKACLKEIEMKKKEKKEEYAKTFFTF